MIITVIASVIVIIAFVLNAGGFLYKIGYYFKLIKSNSKQMTLGGSFGGFDNDDEFTFIIAFYLLKLFGYLGGTPKLMILLKR
jgi:hypothetical protein